MQIKLDRIEGAALRLTGKGYEAERIAGVSGLHSAAPQRLHEALTAPGMPRIGEPHPTIAGLHVASLAARPNGPGAALVTISYHSRPPQHNAEVEVGSTVTQITTDADRAGQRVVVAHSATGDEADLRTQGVRLTMLAPQTTLRFTRAEDASPLAKARQYVGRINATAVFDSAPGTWLCTAITGRSLDGAAYEVTYAFHYDANGWQPVATYLDPQTNRPPPNLIEHIGFKRVRLYREAEFNELGLNP